MMKKVIEIFNSDYNTQAIMAFEEVTLQEVKYTMRSMQLAVMVALGEEDLPTSWMHVNMDDGTTQMGSDLGKAMFKLYFKRPCGNLPLD